MYEKDMTPQHILKHHLTYVYRVNASAASSILKHADKDSNFFCKEESLKEQYRQCAQVLLNGYPDYHSATLNIEIFDPATYPSQLPLPVYFINSPESNLYPKCKRTVDIKLDTIIDSLLNTHEFQLLSAEELEAYEQSTPIRTVSPGAWLNRQLDFIIGEVVFSYEI